jgi:hypothetical protein
MMNEESVEQSAWPHSRYDKSGLKYFWLECDSMPENVVEAPDWEKACRLFRETYKLNKAEPIFGGQEVDLDFLEASGIRFNFLMWIGLGITIND